MASKADKIYYDNLIGAAGCCCRAAEYLVECMGSYKRENAELSMHKMHELEHNADIKKHEMTAMLARAFVTPIDREDLASLSQEIDEVADKLEEIVQRFYIDDLPQMPAWAIEFAGKVGVCVHKMRDMLTELENFKKPAKLRELIIQLSDAEEDCDRMYLDTMRRIGQEYKNDPLAVIAWRAVLDRMEECADNCSHVGDLVELVVMKNT